MTGASNYSCAMLMPIILEHTRIDEKVSVATTKGMRSSYIKRDFPRSRARRVLHLALDQIHGGPVDGAHRIPAFLAALEAKGWTADLLHQDPP